MTPRTKRIFGPEGSRLVIAGLLLMLIVGTVIVIVARRADRVARDMNISYVRESSRDYYGTTRSEFSRTERSGRAVARFIASDTLPAERQVTLFMQTLRQFDPKISSIWVLPAGGDLRIYGDGADRIAADSIRDILLGVPTAPGDTTPIVRLVRTGGTTDLSTIQQVERPDGAVRFSLNISLDGLHTYFSELLRIVKGYITLTDSAGHVLIHPDTARLGGLSPFAAEVRSLGTLNEYGKLLPQGTHSAYLGLPIEQVYYGLPFCGGQMVFSVSFPRLVIQEQMHAFHRYTLILAGLVVLLFGGLLVLAQLRWRREYNLRQKAERDSARMHLQRVINQINPHFLFNSLNSLYALIDTDRGLAREFVLKLSKVYRYVLEASDRTLATVSDEIDFTRKYYFLQKIRFADQIELSIEIGTETDERRIPAMSIQTLVENAIKHNRATAETPLRIRIYTDGDRIVIENTFQPRKDTDGTSLGIGLSRLRTIYRLYTDRKVSAEQAGSVFRCILPLLDKPGRPGPRKRS